MVGKEVSWFPEQSLPWCHIILSLLPFTPWTSTPLLSRGSLFSFFPVFSFLWKDSPSSCSAQSWFLLSYWFPLSTWQDATPTPCQQHPWDTDPLVDTPLPFSPSPCSAQPPTLLCWITCWTQDRFVTNDMEKRGAAKRPSFLTTTKRISPVHSWLGTQARQGCCERYYLSRLTEVDQRLEQIGAEGFGMLWACPPIIYLSSLPEAMRWPRIGVS